MTLNFVQSEGRNIYGSGLRSRGLLGEEAVEIAWGWMKFRQEGALTNSN